MSYRKLLIKGKPNAGRPLAKGEPSKFGLMVIPVRRSLVSTPGPVIDRTSDIAIIGTVSELAKERLS